MRILIIDGQGGGVGRSLVESACRRCAGAELFVVGTNAAATSNMMKGAAGIHGAGAVLQSGGVCAHVACATGENAVIFNSSRVDVIIGPIGIVMANAMLGEITPRMAEAVTSGGARLILIPMNKCHVSVVGTGNKRLSEYIEEAMELAAECAEV